MILIFEVAAHIQPSCLKLFSGKHYKPLKNRISFLITEILANFAFHGLTQKDFDVKWCRGTAKEKIFRPWIDSMKADGCQFLSNKRVTGLCLDEETGHISGVVCGRETYNANAVIMAVRISTLQDIIRSWYASFLSYFDIRFFCIHLWPNLE